MMMGKRGRPPRGGRPKKEEKAMMIFFGLLALTWSVVIGYIALFGWPEAPAHVIHTIVEEDGTEKTMTDRQFKAYRRREEAKGYGFRRTA